MTSRMHPKLPSHCCHYSYVTKDRIAIWRDAEMLLSDKRRVQGRVIVRTLDTDMTRGTRGPGTDITASSRRGHIQHSTLGTGLYLDRK